MKTAATLGVCLVIAVAAVGCATTSAKGPTDEELVQGIVTQWSELLPAGDIDKLMDLYAEDFKFEDGGKAELSAWLKDHNSEVKGAEVDLKSMVVTVKDGKAGARPIGLTVPGFSVDLSLELTEEDGRWLITWMGGA